MTSASPLTYSRSGRVVSVLMSATTPRGCQKAPTRFLPAGRFTPVLPPIALSTCATNVVGTCQKCKPRENVAATNPVRSPTTPPPTARIAVLRSILRRANSFHNRSDSVRDLDASPDGIERWSSVIDASCRTPVTVFP